MVQTLHREKILMRLIEDYAVAAQLAPSYIGKRAVKNANLYSGLADGRSVSIGVFERTRDWLAEQTELLEPK